MVKVIDQDIPAWFYREYQRSLGFAHESKTGSGIFSVRKRPPYKLPHMRTNSGNSPSGAQLKVREAFKKCIDCFNNSPRKGGAIPPELGYRSKEWWYHESNSETWPDYVGQEKQKWNPEEEDAEQWKKSDGNYEPSNWFLQTDEPDFITFYDEMKSKYGFPWSPTNNPDQICIKMNKIVINEIEYNLDQDTSITWTPGETAKARKGVCDDQSVLHYALTYKALTDLGWSAEQINERLAMIPNWCGGGGHVFNWWKQNNGATKIVENTLDPNQAPDVVGDLWYWGHWKSKNLIQRVNKDGAYNPRIIGNGVIYPLWYYNLFIHRSWKIFFDGGVPEWCCKEINCDHGESTIGKQSTLFYNINWATCWANAYSNYDAAEWEPGTYHKKNFLASSAGLLTDNRYYAVIYTNRNILVFKPSNFLTQEEWNKITTVNFRWNPTPYYGYSTEGGEYTLLETGEKKEQIFDWISFTVPKSLGNYNDFRVTLEGNARNSDDLKPATPTLGNPTSVGSHTWLTEARLCVA